ncbi:hypothetical protein BN2497_611 [Janthinobacterium sp. CG23_2]|nr:hypothetical protein BN2497_611 [Janthinobacterium sp. CG23_2]CUU26703.1 hypothetical protein BN3177_611 [Janthinobacterium sp. CG23_2]
MSCALAWLDQYDKIIINNMGAIRCREITRFSVPIRRLQAARSATSPCGSGKDGR